MGLFLVIAHTIAAFAGQKSRIFFPSFHVAGGNE